MHIPPLAPWLRLPALALGLALLTACSSPPAPRPARDLMLIANDQKHGWDAEGRAQIGAPGRDTLRIVDLATDPLAPREVGLLNLPNTIAGPPTNLAVTPDQRLALLANSLNATVEGGQTKLAPGSDVHVIDLTATPPRLLYTVQAGKQPSGLSINRAGTLALVANRAGHSLTVLRIEGQNVRVVDTVEVGESVAHVQFTPDGRRAVAVKFAQHKLALFDVQGERVTYRRGEDVAVGPWPYNVDVTPDGRLALVADNGNNGASDGKIDTVSVVDLTATPPRLAQQVAVGDGPEGLAIRPDGRYAVAVILRGSNAAHSAPFYHRNGSVVLLQIDGTQVRRVNEVEVRGLPEGAVWSADGQHLYVGNFLDSDISVLRIEGGQLVDTGRLLPAGGRPAAMRASR